jgi:nucleoside 2-deoxyribosyltransferase
MRVYVAAPWIKGGDALEARNALVAAGIEVNSRWLSRVKGNTDPDYDYTKDPTYTVPDARAESLKDIEDVLDADAVVVVNSAKSEGKAVETGIAIGAGIPVVVVGERSNTFHYLSEDEGMKVVPNVGDAIAWLVEVDSATQQQELSQRQQLFSALLTIGRAIFSRLRRQNGGRGSRNF